MSASRAQLERFLHGQHLRVRDETHTLDLILTLLRGASSDSEWWGPARAAFDAAAQSAHRRAIAAQSALDSAGQHTRQALATVDDYAR